MSDTDKSLALVLVCIILLSLVPIAGYLAIVLLLSHFIRRNKLSQLFQVLKKDGGLIFLLSAFTLSTLFARHHTASLAGVSVFALQVLLYIIIRSHSNDKTQNFNIIRYMLITSLFVSVLGILQYYFISQMPTGWIDKTLYNDVPNRAFSTLYNPNVLGSYLIIIISVALSGFQCFGNRSGKVLSSLIIVMAYFCMLLTFSRGAWLGLAVSVLIIFAFSRKKSYILSTLAATLLLALPELHSILTRASLSLIADDSSNNYRQYLWKMAINSFTDNPVLGAGIGNFGFSLPSHTNSAGYLISHAHNIYLQILAETGLLGFTAFFGYILATMYISFKLFRQSGCKQTRCLALGVLASFVGLLIHGGVDATLYLPQLSVFVWIMVAVVRNLGEMDLASRPAFTTLALTLKPVLSRIFLNIK